jgi:hypothetical protein
MNQPTKLINQPTNQLHGTEAFLRHIHPQLLKEDSEAFEPAIHSKMVTKFRAFCETQCLITALTTAGLRTVRILNQKNHNVYRTINISER